jgi:N-acetylglutamate synthase-like GNAT family acetyltransferase
VPVIATDRVPTVDQLVELYDSVGWTAYTKDPATLHAAVAGSSFVVTGWDRQEQLVGLARAVSDDASVCYVQDIVVRPERQRGGVGRVLMLSVLARYTHVRQIMLLTDDEDRQAKFYEAMGFAQVGTGEFRSLRTFLRMTSADAK